MQAEMALGLILAQAAEVAQVQLVAQEHLRNQEMVELECLAAFLALLHFMLAVAEAVRFVGLMLDAFPAVAAMVEVVQAVQQREQVVLAGLQIQVAAAVVEAAVIIRNLLAAAQAVQESSLFVTQEPPNALQAVQLPLPADTSYTPSHHPGRIQHELYRQRTSIPIVCH